MKLKNEKEKFTLYESSDVQVAMAAGKTLNNNSTRYG